MKSTERNNLLFTIVEIILIGVIIGLSLKLVALEKKSADESLDAKMMIEAADELRQSSDDLTHFARSYVVTGDPEFWERYYATLDIRNGHDPRPEHYDKIYWDLNDETREKITLKEARSLNSIMEELPYTEEELALLTLSEKNSNDLVNIEVEAFNTLNGRYKDSEGNYTVIGEPDKALAVSLMFSQEYYDAKHEIMQPIYSFLIMLDTRTSAMLEQTSNTVTIYIGLIILTFLILVGVTLRYSLFQRRLHLAHQKKLEANIEELNANRNDLEASETRFLQVAALSGTMVWEINTKGEYVYISPNVEQLLGYRVDEMIGHPFHETVHEEYKEELLLHFNNVVENKREMEEFDIPYQRKDGNVVWLSSNGAEILNEEGERTGFRGAGFDITERKNMEKELVTFKTIADQANYAVVLLDEELNHIYVNDELCSLFKRDADEFIGKSVTVIHPERVLARIGELKHELDMLGGFTSEPIEFVDSEGESFYALLNAQKVYDAEGNFLCISVTYVDVTEQKLQENELRSSEQQLSLAQEIAGMGSWHYNMTDGSGYWSDNCYRLVKKKVGTKIWDMQEIFSQIVLEDQHIFTEAMEEMTKSGKGTDIEFRMLIETGDERWFSLYLRPEMDEEGNIAVLNGVSLDVTDSKQAEDDRVARQVAEQANRSKSVFLSNMSHEIRTPLNAIIGFSQILQRDPTLQPKQVDQIATISRSGEYLLSLINDILDISKIEAGRITINNTNFDLHGVLDEVKLMFSIPAEKRGLSLLFERRENVPEFVSADEGKLKQVMINLIGNALKFTQEGGIGVRCQAVHQDGQQFLNVEVEDSGVGIPKEDIANIFDPFRQSDAGKTIGGTGLGLAISKQMLELMGGSIEVKSTEGQGTLFKFFFPITEVDPKEVSTDHQINRDVIGLSPDSGIIKILVVDDRKENRDLLEDMLKPVGFKVEMAEDGKEGVQKFFAYTPDCVLMDLRMPVLDGYEATTQIKKDEKGSKVPIIAVTASAFDDDEKAVLRSGFDGYLRKPFRRHELFAKLQDLLDVEYIFSAEAADSDEKSFILTREHMENLAPEIITKMTSAVDEGDMEEFREIVITIEAEHPRIANALMELAGKFDYQALMNLLGEE